MYRLDELTKDLEHLLAEPRRDRDSFIRLAVLDEIRRRLDPAPLRRGDAPDALAEQVEARIRETATAPGRDWSICFDDLNDDLADTLHECLSDPAGAVESIDQIIHLGLACRRLGWLTQGEVEALSSRARAECQQLAEKHPEIYEQAERVLLYAGPRAGFDQALSWLEPLARQSQMHLTVAAASRLYSPEKREQIVNRVVDRILQSRSSEQLSTLDLSSAWEQVKAIFAPPRLAARDAAAVVCSFCRGAWDAIQIKAIQSFTGDLAVVRVPGAGVPLTAASPQSVREEFTIHGTIDIDVHLEWTADYMKVAYQIEPPQPGALVLLFEDRKGQQPLASVAVPASATGETSKSVPTSELGFDPTARPWQLRVMLA